MKRLTIQEKVNGSTTGLLKLDPFFTDLLLTVAMGKELPPRTGVDLLPNLQGPVVVRDAPYCLTQILKNVSQLSRHLSLLKYIVRLPSQHDPFLSNPATFCMATSCNSKDPVPITSYRIIQQY